MEAVFNISLLQRFPVTISFKYLHLLNGNVVELYYSFVLRHDGIDENVINHMFFARLFFLTSGMRHPNHPTKICK